VAAKQKSLAPIHLGEILLEQLMRPTGISINRFASDISVPTGRISGIVNGKRGITADTAARRALERNSADMDRALIRLRAAGDGTPLKRQGEGFYLQLLGKKANGSVSDDTCY
jgi:addiction module HigA family antidote